jgi:peptidoglycan/LPS O-acetylase OafA/YrhL
MTAVAPGAAPADRPAAPYRLGHQPGLDGLRAIAIAFVIAAHAFLPFTTGGGLAGVTSFFVLSGYLITRLLVAEEGFSGSIDLVAFYARRVLRLFPALLVLAAVVLVVYAFQGRGLQALTSIPVVLLYSANWSLAQGGATLTPFQHTWSLAIEEQFYILWPPILLLVLRARRPSTRIAGAIALVAVVAIAWRLFIYVAVAANLHEDRVEFGSDTNAYSLLAGCALGLLPSLPRGRIAGVLGVLGLAAIVLSMTLRSVVDVPGWGAFVALPVLAALGALGVIVGVMGGGLRLLGLAPISYVGRISYGLYLWHWVTPRMIEPLPIAEGRTVIAFALAFAASVASFHLVEQPALRLKARFRRVPPEPDTTTPRDLVAGTAAT